MDQDRLLAILSPVLPWAEAAWDKVLAVPVPYWAALAAAASILWLRAARKSRALGRRLVALEEEHADLKDLSEKERMWRLAVERVEAGTPAATRQAAKAPAAF